jgi:flagellar basal body-associated protein FliL
MRVFRIVSVSLLVLTVGLLLFRHGGNYKWSMPWFSQAQGLTGKAGPDDVGPVVRLDPFLFTEWDDDRERLNTVTFELEVNDDQGRDALKSRTSEIRSEILKLLADVQLSTIEDVEGYEALKAQVQQRIQPLVPSHPIRRVLITEFLSQ